MKGFISPLQLEILARDMKSEYGGYLSDRAREIGSSGSGVTGEGPE